MRVIRRDLRAWQSEALRLWLGENKKSGIVGAVTGGGKTVFALACIEAAKPDSALVVVPTTALLDQWWEEAAAFFNLKLDDINIIVRKGKIRRGTINIGVLNTVSRLEEGQLREGMMLVIDECHKAASPEFSRILQFKKSASLGLSATPERPYDDGLTHLLIPSLGPVIFSYTYHDALRDGVIVPFELRNVVFDLEEERQIQHDKLTRTIARMINKHGADAPETISVLLRRSRLLNLSPRRVDVALKIIASHRGQRILVFHEDIESCGVIGEVLVSVGLPARVYHSALGDRERVEALRSYRSGETQILVTCRALDEGFNVPETEVGIIAASTATRRQRIQRLGRALRPANNKAGAIIYTLAATKAEVERLEREEAEMEGVATVTWSKA